MKKHLFGLIVFFCIVLGLCMAMPLCASAETEGYYTYTVSNGEATITYFDTSVKGSITIPSTIGGYPVTEIGVSAFEGCTGLTSITIPDSVTSIGEGAFKGCTSLEEITLPFVGGERGKTGTYDSVFGYIFGYTTISSVIGTTRQYCASSSSRYYYIPSSIKKVVITDEVSIPFGAFYNCSRLTSVTILESVRSIGDYAFRYCTGLTSITIPESVTSIGNYAFKGCTGLTSITIPESVISISYGAFEGCTGLTSITIPESVTSIGNYAFKGCTGLTSITIPESVTSIGNYAFEGCTGLTTITIPGSVTSIGDYAFRNCTGLTTITISEGVTSIGEYAFYGCTGLKSITIPESVTSIERGAFNVCTSLEEITLPFVGSKRGTTGTYDSVFGYIFGYTNSSESGTTCQYYSSYYSYYYYIPSSIKKVVITDETVIPYGAFYNCSMLTSVTIPDSVTSIGDEAFNGCTGLTTITIPESVTSIGSYAFCDCTGLTSIIIPESVTTIGEGAFNGCTSLEEITLPFVGSKRGTTGTYDSVFGYIFGYTTSSSESGTTRQYYSSSSSYYYYIPSSIKKVVITDEDVIPYGAFYNCSNLKEIVLEEDISMISQKAFANCLALTDVTVKNPSAKYANNPNIFENVDFVTLHGYTDSTTQSYAQTYSIPFEALDGGSGEEPGGDGDETSSAYEVSSIKVLSSTDGSELSKIPTGDFIADVSVTNVSSTSKDAIIIAAYDKDGATKSLTYLYATIDKGKTVNLGTVFHNPDGDIVTLKAFVWNSLAGLKPLSGSAVFPK